jgi:hypothetical protein
VNITYSVDFGTTVNFWQVISALVTLGALYVAWRAVKVARESFQLNTFSALLKEISDEKARRDRGIVRDIASNDVENMKKLIEAVRNIKYSDEKTDISAEIKQGEAAERTIARLDRVGFFLIGNGNKLKAETPIWLWTMVKDMYEKLGCWIEYRQRCEKDGKNNYHKGYALYFQKLENYRKTHPDISQNKEAS